MFIVHPGHSTSHTIRATQHVKFTWPNVLKIRAKIYLIDHTLHRTAKPQLRHPGCDIHTRQAILQWITLRNGETKYSCSLCCRDSRLSFCHINTHISKPAENMSWKQFCHKNRVANTVLGTKIASRRCLLQAWKCAKIVFGPDPTGGAYSAPPYPLPGGRGLTAPSPRIPHPPRPFGPLPYGLRCLVPQTPPKINPSYGLEHIRYSFNAGKWQL